MKLQIKDAGAWRNVVEFGEDRRAEVMAAAIPLLKALHPSTAMRISNNNVSLLHCCAPDYMWRAA